MIFCLLFETGSQNDSQRTPDRGDALNRRDALRSCGDTSAGSLASREASLQTCEASPEVLNRSGAPDHTQTKRAQAWQTQTDLEPTFVLPT